MGFAIAEANDPNGTNFSLEEGIEEDLLRRSRTGTIGGVGGVIGFVWAIFQVLEAATKTGYLEKIKKFIDSGQWDKVVQSLSIYDIIPVLLLVVGSGIYLLSRLTGVLLKESEEPFRYTFWIEPFNQVKNTPDSRFTLKYADQFHLLDHDLKERLNQRIRRFLLLDDIKDLSEEDKKALRSHIHISGDYAVREEKEGSWVIHVMPRVRIGPKGRPETIANSVKYPLNPDKKPKTNNVNLSPAGPDTGAEAEEEKRADSKAENADVEYVFECKLEANRYNQIIERVYSSIATEVYRQIESDVKEKINREGENQPVPDRLHESPGFFPRS